MQGSPPCQPLLPRVAVSNRQSGEPDPGCQHEGSDKTGSDSLREPQTSGIVTIYNSVLLVTQKQGKGNRAIW